VSSNRIGVGIIGYGIGRSWAAVAHVPALRVLPGFEVVAVATTRIETARSAATDIGIAEDRAFVSATELAACPDVDLVAVTVKVSHHLEAVCAAVAAGKHVYCEWPLGNGLAEAEQMASLIAKAGVRGVVGLQARCAPPIAYVRDLVASGELGEVLSSNVFATGTMWGNWVDEANVYVLDRANGATLLSIPLGHAVDAMCHCLGEFKRLSATTAIRVPKARLIETGDMIDKTTEDQVAVTGILESGAVAVVHYRGGASRGTNFVWEINGTKGDLRLEGDGGHAQIVALRLSGAFGETRKMVPIEIPRQYRWVPDDVAGRALNVAQAYQRLADDLQNDTATATDFDAAVVRHRMLSVIEESARTGRQVEL
jgi:predicted dehydrogenase